MDSTIHIQRYRRGLALFNEEEFFEAHEVLEDVWRPAPESERKFLQGLIQIAVALHHHSRGNLVGCRSLLARAHRNLSAYPDEHQGVDLASLRGTLLEWTVALERNHPVPPLPKIRL
jgi:predicted metal-dependent hydrolase